jgi:hypothetical protein
MNTLVLYNYLDTWAVKQVGQLYPAIPTGVHNGRMKQIALRHEFVHNIMKACENFRRNKFDRGVATKYFLDKGFSNLQVFELFEIVEL